LNKVDVAIISGSGMDDLFLPDRREKVRTKYGSVEVESVSRGGTAFYHLARHGPGHSVPPHLINYRANIAGLQKLGVTELVSVHAVGSMNEGFVPGELGLIDQFIDFGRTVSFFDDKSVHTDMTRPYDRRLQGRLATAAKRADVKLHRGLVYASVIGPRYETAAEIRMMKMLGADAVGMTGAQEAILANELGLKIASIAVATNWAAGIQERVTHDEVRSMMRARTAEVSRVVEALMTL
jgi:5'-methylthioadenosine phosphorylase